MLLIVAAFWDAPTPITQILIPTNALPASQDVNSAMVEI